MFSCEFCEISKNTFFWQNTSGGCFCHMQWQGNSTNFSTNQVRWIEHSNISWNSRNWNYEPQQNYFRIYSTNLKSLRYDIIEENLKKLKTTIKTLIEENKKNLIKRSKIEMNGKEKRLVDISTLTGVSNWLTVFPITKVWFELSKQ